MSKYSMCMSDYPEKFNVYASVSYGTISFGIAPVLISFLGLGFDLDITAQIWFQLGYYVLNFLAAVFIFLPYLQESFYSFQMEFKKSIKSAIGGAVLIVLIGGVAAIVGATFESYALALGALPNAEVTLFALPSAVIEVQPIWGVLCMVLLTPFSTCLLYYATGFARNCSDNPAKAYIIVALMTAVPYIVNALTFWAWSEELILYLVHLPIHFIACRIYQKTDTVWAPIFTLMLANLISCALFWMIMV